MSYTQGMTPAPKPKARGLFWAVTFAGIAASFLVCAGVTTALTSSTPSSDDSVATSPIMGTKASASAERKAKAEPLGIDSGVWEVGTEVKSGTYVTRADGDCYWARLKAFDGELDSIIANGNLSDGERGRLTVKSTDKGLELSGDCLWTRK